MASYQNTTAVAVTFPSLTDGDGNVLVVEAGATFDAPDGLIADGIVAAGGSSRGRSNPAPADPAPADPAPADPAPADPTPAEAPAPTEGN
jgi:hypothetical protein